MTIMKKQLIVLMLATATFYACNNGSEKTTTTPPVEEVKDPAKLAEEALTKNPDYVKGLELIGKSDCLTCHKIEETSTGPAYRDIANKYANDDKTIEMLSQKIIKGGGGVWGQVAMAPHPTLTSDEAKQLAKYVMLFKNK
jgi:cytochrome c